MALSPAPLPSIGLLLQGAALPYRTLGAAPLPAIGLLLFGMVVAVPVFNLAAAPLPSIGLLMRAPVVIPPDPPTPALEGILVRGAYHPDGTQARVTSLAYVFYPPYEGVEYPGPATVEKNRLKALALQNASQQPGLI